MKIFSGTANRPLAGRIAKQLQTTVGKLEIHVFPDLEKRIRVLENVVGEQTIVVQSTATPADQNYMELFFIVDALKRSGARSVTTIVPYLGYQRQDHVFRDGEAVSLQVIIKTMESVGIDALVVFDLHSIKIPELFHIPVTHLSALSLFAKTIKEKKWNNSETVLVSPDMGGIRRVKMISEMLGGMSFASIVKNRDLKTGELSASKIKGEVKKRAIIIDDMISSGGTIIAAANLLGKKGAEEIFVFATHPVFSQNAHELLQESFVNKVFVTDTIFVPKEKQFAKLKVLSVAKIIAQNLPI